MCPTESLLLDTFVVEAKAIGEVDVGQLHALSMSVGWAHRRDDWQQLRDIGEGIAAVDEIGRVLGSVMWFPQGADFTMIGMLITSPRLQTLGGGRWLMDHALTRGAAPRIALDATRASKKLYRSLGFVAASTVHQYQGEVAETALPDAAAGIPVETAAPEALAEVIALDAAATGVDRSRALRRLATVARLKVVRRDGAIVAFALDRPFGRGHVIGPIVAPSEAEAIALAAAAFADHVGDFVRVDTVEGVDDLSRFLVEAGLVPWDTATYMTLGAEAPPLCGPARPFGLASQALG